MEVFLGGTRHLEALPGVSRAPVQQFGSGHIILARNADFPVTIDHKLGASILQGCVKKEEKCDVTVKRLSPRVSGSSRTVASCLYMAAASPRRRDFFSHDRRKHVPSPAPPQRSDKAFYKQPVCSVSGSYFGLINKHENRCPWLL